MDYKNKYLKYKNKYLELKNKMYGGLNLVDFIPSNNFEEKLCEIIYNDSFVDNIEDIQNIENIYYPVYTIGENKMIKFNVINKEIPNIINKYPGNNNITYFKNDTTSVVFVFNTIVLRIFKYSSILNSKLNLLFDILKRNECPNLEHIYEICINEEHQLYYVVSKKLQIFKNNKPFIEANEATIKTQIIEALKYLKNNNWSHRDTSIDNIGYDIESNTFKLYDFGMSEIYDDISILESNYIKDLESLDRSFNHHLNRRVLLRF